MRSSGASSHSWRGMRVSVSSSTSVPVFPRRTTRTRLRSRSLRMLACLRRPRRDRPRSRSDPARGYASRPRRLRRRRCARARGGPRARRRDPRFHPARCTHDVGTAQLHPRRRRRPAHRVLVDRLAPGSYVAVTTRRWSSTAKETWRRWRSGTNGQAQPIVGAAVSRSCASSTALSCSNPDSCRARAGVLTASRSASPRTASVGIGRRQALTTVRRVRSPTWRPPSAA